MINDGFKGMKNARSGWVHPIEMPVPEQALDVVETTSTWSLEIATDFAQPVRPLGVCYHDICSRNPSTMFPVPD